MWSIRFFFGRILFFLAENEWTTKKEAFHQRRYSRRHWKEGERNILSLSLSANRVGGDVSFQNYNLPPLPFCLCICVRFTTFFAIVLHMDLA